MNATATNTESAPYAPRKRSEKEVKKPLRYPGNLVIKGTPNMVAEIERRCPDDGNRRRESLMLTDVWHLFEGGCGQGYIFPYSVGVPKSAVIALAASALQSTAKAFGGQPRKGGDGFSRAKCTMAKTCHWMMEVGLFVAA